MTKRLSAASLIVIFALLYSGIHIESDLALYIGIGGLLINALWNLRF